MGSHNVGRYTWKIGKKFCSPSTRFIVCMYHLYFQILFAVGVGSQCVEGLFDLDTVNNIVCSDTGSAVITHYLGHMSANMEMVDVLLGSVLYKFVLMIKMVGPLRA